MLTIGINKDLDKQKFPFGSQEHNEINLKSMIESCFVYGGCEKDSYNFSRYIKKSGSELSEEVFEEVYKEQTDYMKNHCIINHNVYEDSEGCTYNSIEHI